MSTTLANIRSSLVTNAVSFLRDPKTQEATLDKKIEFLKVKGLSSEEITAALQQVGISVVLPPSNSAQQADGEFFAVPSTAVQAHPNVSYAYNTQLPPYGVLPREEDDRRDWKDWFVMAVISGTAMVGVYSLARKFLFPHLVPPPLNAFQETQSALDAQFDLVAKQLAGLTEQSEAQKKAAEEQKDQIDKTVQAVERALQEIKDGEERAKAELKEIRDEVENIRELVPKLIQSSQSSATNTLSDVQQELKSLKTLLLSRPPPQSSLTPGPPSPSGAPGSAYPYPSSLPFGAGSAPQSQSATPTPPYLLSGRPFIPSWQIASKSNADAAKVEAETAQKNKEKEQEPLDASAVLVGQSSAASEANATNEA